MVELFFFLALGLRKLPSNSKHVLLDEVVIFGIFAVILLRRL